MIPNVQKNVEWDGLGILEYQVDCMMAPAL